MPDFSICSLLVKSDNIITSIHIIIFYLNISKFYNPYLTTVSTNISLIYFLSVLVEESGELGKYYLMNSVHFILSFFEFPYSAYSVSGILETWNIYPLFTYYIPGSKFYCSHSYIDLIIEIARFTSILSFVIRKSIRDPQAWQPKQ